MSTIDPRRLRGERGMAMVSGLVLLFAFTAGSMIWLARDVNRSVSNRTAAQSIAFQAARSGAQQLSVRRLRDDAAALVDPARATSAARATAGELLRGYAVAGSVVRIDVLDPQTVEVEIVIHDPAGDVTGIAVATAEVGG